MYIATVYSFKKRSFKTAEFKLGRNLDCIIGRQLFGMTWIRQWGNDKEYYYNRYADREIVPYYSTEKTAFAELLKCLRSQYTFKIIKGEDSKWICSGKMGEDCVCDVPGKTKKEAVLIFAGVMACYHDREFPWHWTYDFLFPEPESPPYIPDDKI